MKSLFIILLTSIAGCAQPFTFNDIPFLGQTTTAAAFSPADVSGLVMWYKADAIAGKSVGDLVTNWVDSSVSGYTLQNGAANQQPYYTNNASEINNKPYLYFDGSDDRLAHGAPSVFAQPNTIFSLVKFDDYAAARCAYDGTNAATNERLINGAGAYPGVFAGGTLALPLAETRWYLFEGLYNGVSSKIITNGVTGASGSAGTESLSGFRVGASHASASLFLGRIAEIIVYNADVSTNAGNLANIRTYFTNKYGAYASW